MPTIPVTVSELQAAIRNVPDFPKPGIQFKDITPVLSDARLFAGAMEHMAGDLEAGLVDAVVGIDARGFIFAAAAALKLQAGLVPVRKKGKLPWRTFEESYDLEYGANTVAIHQDALRPGSRVLLVDDLLATGGTAAAAVALIRRTGAQIVAVRFLIELTFLGGRQKLPGLPVQSVLTY
jgi:adenine phosphoribosyltransferase